MAERRPIRLRGGGRPAGPTAPGTRSSAILDRARRAGRADPRGRGPAGRRARRLDARARLADRDRGRARIATACTGPLPEPTLAAGAGRSLPRGPVRARPRRHAPRRLRGLRPRGRDRDDRPRRRRARRVGVRAADDPEPGVHASYPVPRRGRRRGSTCFPRRRPRASWSSTRPIRSRRPGDPWRRSSPGTPAVDATLVPTRARGGCSRPGRISARTRACRSGTRRASSARGRPTPGTPSRSTSARNARQ